MMGLAVKPCIITALLLCFVAVAAQNLNTFSATYDRFYSRDQNRFQLQNAAGFSDGYFVALTMINPITQLNLSGRMMLNQRFKLWEQGYDKTSDWVASFNCSFLFRITPYNNYGEGLAFVLAPDTDIPSNSFGQYLGLTNSSTDGSPANRLVAIEFDNFKEDFDPDANHVGLNINSIISNTTVSLTPLGIELAPEKNYDLFYNVWVYIGPQPELGGETPSRPDTPVLKSNLDLSEVLDQYSYFGFSASTGHTSTQFHSVYGMNLTVHSYLSDAPAPKDKHQSWEKTLLVVGVGFPLLMMGAALTGYCYPLQQM